MSALEDAQHEAAHVVVGVSLGLRLVRATVLSPVPDELGFAEFYEGAREAFLLMYAAGLHARVTRALLEGDLDHAGVQRLGRGARIRGL
jgi:hypothetical protein